MLLAQNKAPAASQVCNALENFGRWLDRYGETSWDHQSYYAGPVGGRAKGLYYRHKFMGIAAVAPMVFSEAFFPAARRLFHHRMRLPIADAHYSMGFAFLHEATGNPAHLEKAVHFLEVLKASRSPGFKEYCWGYPFDWVTRNGVIKAHTPLITTTPYVFEAFLQAFRLLDGRSLAPSDGERTRVRGAVVPSTLYSQPLTSDGRPLPSALGPPSSVLRPPDQREEWRQILASTARHATTDIQDRQFPGGGNTCSYMPGGEFNVVNASAYRAGMLVVAAKFFDDNELMKIASGNVNFVLAAQNADGSWPYAKDGVRDFVDHFHTCFVMKALAKIYLQLRSSRGNEARTDIGNRQSAIDNSSEPPHVGSYGSRSDLDERRILDALKRGVDYYLGNLFGDDGMPRPFSKAPRLTVYKCELYDCAECINLCLLLRNRFPQLNEILETVVTGVLADWVRPNGSFRSRKLMLGWDDVPMHRWAQSQMFRSLAFYLKEKAESGNLTAENQAQISAF